MTLFYTNRCHTPWLGKESFWRDCCTSDAGSWIEDQRAMSDSCFIFCKLVIPRSRCARKYSARASLPDEFMPSFFALSTIKAASSSWKEPANVFHSISIELSFVFTGVGGGVGLANERQRATRHSSFQYCKPVFLLTLIKISFPLSLTRTCSTGGFMIQNILVGCGFALHFHHGKGDRFWL